MKSLWKHGSLYICLRCVVEEQHIYVRKYKIELVWSNKHAYSMLNIIKVHFYMFIDTNWYIEISYTWNKLLNNKFVRIQHGFYFKFVRMVYVVISLTSFVGTFISSFFLYRFSSIYGFWLLFLVSWNSF